MIAATLTRRQFNEAIIDSRHPRVSFRPSEPYRHAVPRTGRNDRCPCGSGVKFKWCHLLAQQGFRRIAS